MNTKICIAFFFILIGFVKVRGQDSLLTFSKDIDILYKKGAYTKSEQVFQKKINFLKQKDNLEEYLYAYWDYFMLAPSQNRIGLLEVPLKNSWRLPKSESEQIAQLHLMVNKAYHLKLYGAIHQSIIAYEKALNYYEKHELTSYNIVEYCLKPLANNCTRIGDYQRADDLLKKTLQIATLNKDYLQISSTLNNLAISYHSQGKFKQALAILNQAANIQSITPKQKSRIHAEIAKNHYELKEYKKAIKEVDFSNQLVKSRSNNSPVIKLRNHTTKALCYVKLKQPDTALKELYKALNLAKKSYSKHDREIAKLYNVLGEIFFLKKEYTKALNSFQNSLKTLIAEYHPQDIYTNPDAKLFFPENTIKDALDSRAKIFIQLGEFDHALESYELSFKQEDLLRTTYTSQYSKILQENANRKRSNQVIDLCYQLYLKSGEKPYIQKAFNFAERSKSMVLLDELQNKNFKNNLQNDSLIILEKELVFQKARLSKELQLAKFSTDYPQSKLESLLSERNKISNELQILKSHIHEKYPFTINSDSLNILTEIQEKLAIQDQTLVEYFVGEHQTYIFKITPQNSISWRIIDNKNYQQSLHQLLLFYADLHGNKIINELALFKEVAHQVYQKLLEPELINHPSKLIIIPDGLLSFIPFDALITKKSQTTNFEKIPFLLFKNDISYANSSRILLQKKTKSETTTKVVGFFPVFEQKHRGLSPLPNTLKEASEINAYFKARIFTRQQATSTQFIDELNEAQILHISTHANTTSNSQPAAIEFWDKTIYLTELYGYQTASDLVVLSACETGIGEVQKGEGAMSLARGFSFTGVKNLVVSLWKVNDKATSLLMGEFYKNLSNKIAFESALQNAKRNYLSNKAISNAKKSPYYWASFIPIKNNMTPFSMNAHKNRNLIWYSLIALVAMLLFVFIKRH